MLTFWTPDQGCIHCTGMQYHIYTEFSSDQKDIFDQSTELISVIEASQKATELTERVEE